jgi:hypothetical protein
MSTPNEAAMRTAPTPQVGVKGRILRRVVRTFNPLALPMAGRRFVPLWAVIHHRGRVSGREFTAPVAIVKTDDGFVIPTPFAAAQWPLNVLAAGRAELRWKGHTYLANSVTAEGPEASAEFGRVERAGIQALGIQRFIHLRDVTVVKS